MGEAGRVMMKNSCPEKAVTSVAWSTQISEHPCAPKCAGTSPGASQVLCWLNDNAVRYLLLRVDTLLGGADEEESGCFGLDYVSSIDTLCRHGHNTLICLPVKHRQSHQHWGGPGAAPLSRSGLRLPRWAALSQQILSGLGVPLGAACTLLVEISPTDPYCLYLTRRFQIKVVL